VAGAAECKVCGEAARFICTTVNEHGSVKEIHTWRCRNCGLVFVSNHLTDEELQQAYGTMDMETYYAETRQENASKIRTACEAVARLTGGTLSSRILDIGCGNGEFLLELRRQGYQCLSGHEIPGADLSDLECQGITIYRDSNWASLPSAAFDVVTMLDVAEHVPSPIDLFRQCRRVLKPGGYLYFHTPCVTRLDRMMQTIARTPGVGRVGRIWQRGRTSIFHLQNHTERSLGIVLSKSGFVDVEIQRQNELSWPVHRYVRVYLCEKQHLPLVLAPILAPLVYPFLATRFFNPNKGIVTARCRIAD
jgi:SAM-dependent methyltransferase